MLIQESFDEHDWQRGGHDIPGHLMNYYGKRSDVYVCTKCGQIALSEIGKKPAFEHNSYLKDCGEEITRYIMDR